MRLILSISDVVICLFLPRYWPKPKKSSPTARTTGATERLHRVAESRALLKAKQIAVEQAGTYVESYSEVNKFDSISK